MSVDEADDLGRVARFWDARGRENADCYSTPGGGAFANSEDFELSGEELVVQLEQIAADSFHPEAFVLDLGCGSGRLTAALARRVRQVQGVDIAESMIAAWADRHSGLSNASAVCAPAESVNQLHSDEADLVLMFGLLLHYPTENLALEALRAACECVAEGGKIIFDVRNGPRPLPLPGDNGLPSRVLRHPLWAGTRLSLENTAVVLYEEALTIDLILGSETGRALVVATRND